MSSLPCCLPTPLRGPLQVWWVLEVGEVDPPYAKAPTVFVPRIALADEAGTHQHCMRWWLCTASHSRGGSLGQGSLPPLPRDRYRSQVHSACHATAHGSNTSGMPLSLAGVPTRWQYTGQLQRGRLWWL